MRSVISRHYRIILVVVCLVLICVVAVAKFKESNEFYLPDYDFVYDTDYHSEYELDDYKIYVKESENGTEYLVEHKETGATRSLFNNPFEPSQYIFSIVTYENKVYYGTGEGFYCYDVDSDTTTKVYSHITKPISVVVFDVTVYFRAITRTEIETYVQNYIISNGNLIICTNRGVLKYDGKSTKELLKGNYNVISCSDGVLKLQNYCVDEVGNKEGIRYEYDIENNVLLQ